MTPTTVPSEAFGTPILVVGFNRPSLLSPLVRQLRKLGPREVFVVIDGPRPDNFDDEKACRHSATVMREVGEFSRLFIHERTENFGLRRSITEAVSWVLRQRREVIVLEDDCLPSQAFFEFCQWALRTYRRDFSISHVSGTNFFPELLEPRNCPIRTNFVGVWGWATWSDRWNLYDETVLTDTFLEVYRRVSWTGQNLLFALLWFRHLKRIQSGSIDSWAYIWQISLWRHRLQAVAPPANLVQNTGIGESATNTKSSRLATTFAPLATNELFPPQCREASEVIENRRYEAHLKWLVLTPLGPQVRWMLRFVYVHVLRKVVGTKKVENS